MFFAFTAFDNRCSVANFSCISGSTRSLIILSHSYQSSLAYLKTAIASAFRELPSLILEAFMGVATGDKTTGLQSTKLTVLSQALAFWSYLKLELTKWEAKVTTSIFLKNSPLFFFFFYVKKMTSYYSGLHFISCFIAQLEL